MRCQSDRDVTQCANIELLCRPIIYIRSACVSQPPWRHSFCSTSASRRVSASCVAQSVDVMKSSRGCPVCSNATRRQSGLPAGTRRVAAWARRTAGHRSLTTTCRTGSSRPRCHGEWVTYLPQCFSNLTYSLQMSDVKRWFISCLVFTNKQSGLLTTKTSSVSVRGTHAAHCSTWKTSGWK